MSDELSAGALEAASEIYAGHHTNGSNLLEFQQGAFKQLFISEDTHVEDVLMKVSAYKELNELSELEDKYVAFFQQALMSLNPSMSGEDAWEIISQKIEHGIQTQGSLKEWLAVANTFNNNEIDMLPRDDLYI